MKENLAVLSNKKILVASWVAVLTIVTIGFSYAAFFSVKTSKNNQTITTGDLSIAYGGSSTSINKTDMLPMSDEEGMSQSEASIIYLQNNGSLNANYALTIGYDMEQLSQLASGTTDKLTPLNHIRLAVYDYQSATNNTLICGPLSVTDLATYSVDTTDMRNNRYSILFGSLGAVSNNVKTYQIKIWLSDKAPASVGESLFYVNSEIVSEATNTKMAYTINGILKNKDGQVINGATVSLQNNSQKVTTNAEGKFSFTNILPGTYNLDITSGTKTFSGNIVVREGEEASITNRPITFTPSINMPLYEASYANGTSIGKLASANNILNPMTYTFTSGTTYNLYPSVILTGGKNPEINNFIINLKEGGINNFTLE